MDPRIFSSISIPTAASPRASVGRGRLKMRRPVARRCFSSSLRNGLLRSGAATNTSSPTGSTKSCSPVVERLQGEIEGETDSLPLLAFVLQRLMREHTGVPTIGLAELERTGGVAAAIESEAEAALADAGFGTGRGERRDALRRLFIPRLARIDRDSRAPQRRIAQQSELPADLRILARALTQRRLLVVKLAAEAEGKPTADAATLEVAHEALLRRWQTLADPLAEDRDALLLLDRVVSAAADWDKAKGDHKADFLAHRGSSARSGVAKKSGTMTGRNQMLRSATPLNAG